MLEILCACVLVFGFSLGVISAFADKKTSRLPNGPISLPFLGNIWTFWQLGRYPNNTCERLARDYGDLATLKVGKWPVIFINTPEDAYELLQKRAKLSSDRPTKHRYRYDNLPGRIIVGPVDQESRGIRKSYHVVTSKTPPPGLRLHQEDESMYLIQNLLQKPAEFLMACDRFAINIMSRAIYGERLSESQDEIVTEMYGVWKLIYLYFLPWTLPIDYFPILLWIIPTWMQYWHWMVKDIVHREGKAQRYFMERLQSSLAAGIDVDSFAASLIKQRTMTEKQVEYTRNTLGMLHGAGSDTTSGVLQVFFKVMALHPNQLKQAQKEIDSVVGRGRLPSWKDEPNLPYTKALIKELQRWAPLAIIGVPHAATEEILYGDYIIPKGTILIPNITALSANSSRYPNPSAFNPSRFLGDELDPAASAMQGDWQSRDHFMYGFGRRFCPGSHVAESTLYIAIARMIWAFDIQAVPGHRLDIEDQRKGLLRKPNPFKITITPRENFCWDVVGARDRVANT